MKKIRSLLCLAIIFILISLTDGTDKNSLDISIVKVDSDPNITVHSLRFDSPQPEPITIAFGKKYYKIPFENISRLELFKKSDASDIFHARINESNGLYREGTLVYMWNLIGTIYSEGSIKGNFYRPPSTFNKIIIINASRINERPLGVPPSQPIGGPQIKINVPIYGNISINNILKNFVDVKNNIYILAIGFFGFGLAIVSIVWFRNNFSVIRKNPAKNKSDTAARITESLPQNARNWNNKGLVLGMQSKYDEAIQAFNKAIQIYPQYAEAWNNKGLALSIQNKYDEAIKAYDISIQLNPQFAETWYNKGHTLLAIGRHEDAIKAFDKAIELDPRHAEAWNDKGVALKVLGRTAEADAAIAKAKELEYTS